MITLVVAWAAWLVIVFYVQATAKDMVPFDPFAILGVSCPRPPYPSFVDGPLLTPSVCKHARAAHAAL